MLKRRIIVIFLSLISVLFLQSSFEVFAQADATKGSVCVTLKTSETAVSGAELTAYQVAELKDSVSYYDFVYTNAFATCDCSLSELENSKSLDKLWSHIEKNNINGMTVKTDAEGKAVFSDLPRGLYFVKQTSKVDGFTECIPFVVSVPMKESENLVYDVDASPKTDVERLVDISVKKIWNNGKLSHPDSIKVQLLNGNAVIETVTLDAKNNWSYKWQDMSWTDSNAISEVDIPKGYTATYTKNGTEFIITNSSVLIQTGQLLWPVPVLVIVGLIFISFGWILLCRRRNKRG